jgi:1,4-dihydroxy-2-naphthoyl-CoA hydrolase
MNQQGLTSYYRVRLTDTDAAGVVYFASLMSICHIAYEEILINRGINLQNFVKEGTIAIPIIHGEIDCLHPIHWGDLILITLTPHFLSDTELVMTYQLTAQENSGQLLAKGKTRHVCIHPQTRQRLSFPYHFQEALLEP